MCDNLYFTNRKVELFHWDSSNNSEYVLYCAHIFLYIGLVEFLLGVNKPSKWPQMLQIHLKKP